jgi:hypothetical protein
MCAACAGVGFVVGSVIEKVSESNGQVNQASPEAYSLLNKSIEENKRLLEELKKEKEENGHKEKQTQEQLAEVRAKINNPELRQPHETEESLKRQEALLINEVNNIHRRGDEIANRLTKLENQQTQVTATGASVASGSISGTNLSNMANNFKPSFTTRLIIAGAVILLVYLLVVKK